MIGGTVYIAPAGSTDPGEWLEVGEVTALCVESDGLRTAHTIEATRYRHSMSLLLEATDRRDAADIAVSVPGAAGW